MDHTQGRPFGGPKVEEREDYTKTSDTWPEIAHSIYDAPTSMRGTLSSRSGFIKGAFVPSQQMLFRRRPATALAAYDTGLAYLEEDRGRVKMTFFTMQDIDFLVYTRQMLAGMMAVAGRSSNDKKAVAVGYNVVKDEIFLDIMNFWRDAVFGKSAWGNADYFKNLSQENFKFMNHAHTIAGDPPSYVLYEKAIHVETEVLEGYEIEPDKLMYVTGKELTVVSDPPYTGHATERVGVSSLHINLANAGGYRLEYESRDVLKLTLYFTNDLSKMWFFRADKKEDARALMAASGVSEKA